MVWHDVTFDPSRCPNCGMRMRLSRVEPRPVGFAHEFDRHIYRCLHCDNISRFVVDRRAAAEAMTA
ncbi:DNA-directed RNA polymerase subunit RPC12/RpoP [Rhodopseudomonas rhenobacensis]|uniref:DNA-directed RNA polymerase subunit RPC12/RpoP n=1 Tax=Rhodopseudomonas rhenobacensis TaxID=87461 RepID=A0A7W7Z1T3_9BRAD|nr:hypothetical protein [Rhodopseudomonas rhenobacensis]MBB5046319.1 DNA-directed RNA polymerase subunit RPC12/RpoP [Rhodopseudomonas rhenobacensis]